MMDLKKCCNHPYLFPVAAVVCQLYLHRGGISQNVVCKPLVGAVSVILLWLTVGVFMRVVSYKDFALEMHMNFCMKLTSVVLEEANQDALTGGPGSAQWILRWEFFGQIFWETDAAPKDAEEVTGWGSQSSHLLPGECREGLIINTSLKVFFFCSV